MSVNLTRPSEFYLALHFAFLSPSRPARLSDELEALVDCILGTHVARLPKEITEKPMHHTHTQRAVRTDDKPEVMRASLLKRADALGIPRSVFDGKSNTYVENYVSSYAKHAAGGAR